MGMILGYFVLDIAIDKWMNLYFTHVRWRCVCDVTCDCVCLGRGL